MNPFKSYNAGAANVSCSMHVSDKSVILETIKANCCEVSAVEKYVV